MNPKLGNKALEDTETQLYNDPDWLVLKIAKVAVLVWLLFSGLDSCTSNDPATTRYFTMSHIKLLICFL